MSDFELRRILQDVIEDLDSGRVRLAPRGAWRRAAGAAILAAGLGLGGLSGCTDRAVGVGDDAGARDARVWLDAGPNADYDTPPVLDAGPMPEYGEPFLDAGPNEDYSVPPVLDGGGDFLYAVPEVDAAVPPEQIDAGNASLYAAPAYGVPPVPPADPD